ncbi:unnamed protein product, partial [Nesidiocoris tenuis]
MLINRHARNRKIPEDERIVPAGVGDKEHVLGQVSMHFDSRTGCTETCTCKWLEYLGCTLP